MHVAIIPDGNRRWAKQNDLTTNKGHEAGFEALRTILKECRDTGPTILSFYAFSTENFQRSEQEVKNLFHLLEHVLEKFSQELHENNIQLRISGSREGLSKKLLKKFDQALELCKEGAFILNICFNYGSQEELSFATQQIAKKIKNSELTIEEITPKLIQQYFWNQDLPPVDLLIRSSGEYRISNFMLWQCSYAEFFFSEKLWPDFSPDDFKLALDEFHRRQRRYGK